MDLADHFRVIAHNWWRILLASLLVASAVYYLSASSADVYESSTQLGVTSARASVDANVRDETVFLAETYAERASTTPVIREAKKISGLPISVDEAMDRLSTTPVGDLGFLELTARGPTPRAARQLSDALAQALIEDVNRQQDLALDQDLQSVNAEIDALAAELDSLAPDSAARPAIEARYEALVQSAVERRTQPRNRVEIVSSAEAPSAPVSPTPIRNSVLAFLVAMVVAAELGVVGHALSDRLPRGRDAAAIGQLVGYPVLASVPRGSGAPVVEAFRTLRTSLMALPPGERPTSIAIVSATEGAGKSFTAINLARSMGAQEAGVLLIDGDLRRPALHERLNLERDPGVTDVLEHQGTRGAVHSVGVGAEYAVGEPRRFLAIPSGHPVQDPVATLSGDAVHRLVSILSDPPRLTIIDTPPAALFADALTIAAQCDAVIIVLDAKASRVRQIIDVTDAVTRSGARILGVVLNRADVARQGRYYGYTATGR